MHVKMGKAQLWKTSSQCGWTWLESPSHSNTPLKLHTHTQGFHLYLLDLIVSELRTFSISSGDFNVQPRLRTSAYQGEWRTRRKSTYWADFETQMASESEDKSLLMWEKENCLLFQVPKRTGLENHKLSYRGLEHRVHKMKLGLFGKHATQLSLEKTRLSPLCRQSLTWVPKVAW